MSLKVTEVDVEKCIKECPITPPNTKVVLKSLELVSTGRIIVPKGSREAPIDIGWIIRVGKDVTDWKAGMLVTYGKYAGYYLPTLSSSCERYYCLDESDITGEYDIKYFNKMIKKENDD